MNERIIDKLSAESAERIATLQLLLDRAQTATPTPEQPKFTGWVMPKRGDMLKVMGDSNSHGFPLGTLVEFHYCTSGCYGSFPDTRTMFWVAKHSGDQRTIAPEDCAPLS